MEQSDDNLLLSLRFYDINNPVANAPVKAKDLESDQRNTYFRVRKGSKFGSLIKKFASLNNHTYSDLTFYHLKRFLSPELTIEELGLKNDDQILVRKLIPIIIHFTDNSSFLKDRDKFQVLSNSVMIKVEEDCTLQRVFEILLDHLQISDSQIAEYQLNAKSLDFFKVSILKSSQRKVYRIPNLNVKMNKIEIGANTNLIVRCTTEQLELFMKNFTPHSSGKLGSSVQDTKTLADEKLLNEESLKKISVLESQLAAKITEKNALAAQLNEKTEEIAQLQRDKQTANQENADLRRKLLDLQHNLNTKALAINELQTEKNKLAESTSILLQQTAEFNTTKKHLQEAKHDCSTAQQKILELRQELNNVNLEKTLEVEKSQNLTTILKAYIARSYNETGSIVSNFLSMCEHKVSELRKLHQINDTNSRSSAKLIENEINLKPLDFDYINLILRDTKVDSKFYEVEIAENNDLDPSAIKRPEPSREYFSDDLIYTIFKFLYAHKSGMTVADLSRVTQIPSVTVGQMLVEYQTKVQARDQSILYELTKTWSVEDKSSIYRYVGLVPWKFDATKAVFQPIKEENLPTKATELINYNFFDMNNDVVEKMKMMAGELEGFKQGSNLIDKRLKNVSKNLYNVLSTVKKFKDREEELEKEKITMVNQFKQELAQAGEKIQFISTFDSKLKDITETIENLREEKIKFEKDNDIYAKFSNFLPSVGTATKRKLLDNGETRSEKKLISNSFENNTGRHNEVVKTAARREKSGPAELEEVSMDLSMAEPEPAEEPAPEAVAVAEPTAIFTAKTNNEPVVEPKTEVSAEPDSAQKVTETSMTSETPLGKRKISEETSGIKKSKLEPTFDGSTLQDTTAATNNSATPENQYLNIKIDMEGAEPVFFKIKKITKLKKVLRSYKAKLMQSGRVSLTSDQINRVKFCINGKMVDDYSVPLEHSDLKNYSIIVAIVQ